MDAQAQIEFFQRLIGNSQTHRAFFTPEVVELISEEFEIPQAYRDEIGQILEVAAYAYISEARVEALDFKRVRYDLHSLGKATQAFVTILDNLAPDTLEILVRMGVVQQLENLPLPRISQSETSTVLEYRDPANEVSRRISLSEAKNVMSAIGHYADCAHEKVVKYRKGRPEKGALVDLLRHAFQVWESLLGRPFKLYWAANGEPITDAAMFGARIVRVVAPAATLQQIATASRKVREKGMSVSNLEEVPEVIEHYRKQF